MPTVLVTFVLALPKVKVVASLAAVEPVDAVRACAFEQGLEATLQNTRG